MDRTSRCTSRSTKRCTIRRTQRGPRRLVGAIARFGVAPLLLAVALVAPCRADSTLQTAAPGSGPISASAQLDFRVTVLPMLALAIQADGVRIQANSGALTLQRGPTDASDGSAPSASAQLRSRRQVIDTSMHASAFGGGDLITIASP